MADRRNAPERAVGVVGHEERAIVGHGHPDGRPRRAVVDHEAGQEILVFALGPPFCSWCTRITLLPVRPVRFQEPWNAAKISPR